MNIQGKFATIIIFILGLLIGVFAYSFADAQQERAFMPLVETCVGYEVNMDKAVILLQTHCLKDDVTDNYNNIFCDGFIEAIKNYNWEENEEVKS